MVEVLRDFLLSVFEAGALLKQQRQGVITRQLAAWAAILAVPTAIAGIYGMSFQFMPEPERVPAGRSAVIVGPDLEVLRTTSGTYHALTRGAAKWDHCVSVSARCSCHATENPALSPANVVSAGCRPASIASRRSLASLCGRRLAAA